MHVYLHVYLRYAVFHVLISSPQIEYDGIVEDVEFKIACGEGKIHWKVYEVHNSSVTCVMLDPLISPTAHNLRQP